jgi:hypothetical protein
MSIRRPIAPVVLLGTTILACGNAEKDTTPPVLQAAAVGDASSIRLTFSEKMVVGSANPAAFRLSLAVKDTQSTVYYALAYDGLSYDSDDGPISDGDPSAATNASMSGSATATGGGESTTYSSTTYTSNGTYDPTNPDPTGYDDGGYEGGYAIPGAPDDLRRPIPTRFISDLGITSVRAVDGQPNQIELVLAGPLADTPACDLLPELAADSGKAGIFVHHKEGPASPTDAADNTPADLAAHWVDASSKAYVEIRGDFPNMNPYLPINCP